MNDNLLRDLHEAQIEEIAMVKRAVRDLVEKPSPTTDDVEELKELIAKIETHELSDTVLKEALGRLYFQNKKLEENADNHLKWLQSIHSYSESLNKKRSSESEVMAQGIEELKKANETLKGKSTEFKLHNWVVFMWALGVTLMTAHSLYEQHSMRDQLVQLREDSLKYRYIKMKGEASPKRIAEIEDIFVYNRDYDKIIEMRDDVKAFEDAVAKKAIADEQARLAEQEAERQ